MAAAAALNAPPVAGLADFPAIGDYALIGNCRTAALVAKDGSVEWMCVPIFSSPSLFGAILDRSAGHFRVATVERAEITRRYLPATNVLETTMRTGPGVLRLTDCLTLEDGGERELYPEHELLRRVECVEGEVEVEVSFAPRWDYGAARPGFSNRRRLGWALTGCPFGAVLLADIDLAHDAPNARLYGRVRLRKGDCRWLSLAYDQNEAVVVPALGDAAQRRLEATIGWWKAWTARCRYEGPHADLVERSILALKLMTSSTTGAVIAAPTTSLPEQEGGPRNWDYRFCWIRDSALVLHAFLSLGYLDEAEAFLEWLLHATRLTWQRFQVMYDIFGETKLDEKTLPLTGYRGARPVRVGNAAHDQLQLDIYGELLETVTQYVQAGGTLDRAACGVLAGVGKRILESWRCPDQGIWETRAGPRHHTFSKAMCWVAVDRLRKLCTRFEMDLDGARLDATCDEIRAEIESKGFDMELDSYVAYYGAKQTDASLLLLARYGYAKPGDERMEGTYRCLERTLMREGLVMRYVDNSAYDGIAGGENSFAPCNFWAVEYLANAGHTKEAEKFFDRLCAAGNDVGLFAEEMRLGDGCAMGNFPQAFTHVSLISAAIALYKRPTA